MGKDDIYPQTVFSSTVQTSQMNLPGHTQTTQAKTDGTLCLADRNFHFLSPQ